MTRRSDAQGRRSAARMRRGPRLAGVVVLLAIAIVFMVWSAGCADGDVGGSTTLSTAGTTSTPSTSARSELTPRKIAIIAPEKANDFGWNQQGVESATAIAEELHAQIEVSDGAGYDDISPIFRQLVAGGADWIILWAGGYNSVGLQLAEERAARTVVVDLADQGLIEGLCTDFETRAQEGAYLAGIIAAKMTKTGTLGIVASSSVDPNWNKMAAGFVTGARAARPDINVEYAALGEDAYADAASGKRVTETVIAAGADIILGMGDGSTFGMIQAVENATPPAGADKVWFIDVIGDKTSIDSKGVLLTSIVWDYLPLLRSAVRQIEEGTYGTSVGYLDLENGGIRLLLGDRIPADVQAAVEEAKQGIISGSVTVPEIYEASALKALLD